MSSIGGTFTVPPPYNEPFRSFAPGSADAVALAKELVDMRAGAPYKVPLIISGKPIFTSKVGTQPICTDHATPLCNFSLATKEHVGMSVSSALEAKEAWAALPFEERAAVFLKAGDLVCGKYRYKLLAATMLGQGKNVWQAEIEASVEAADFCRFNPSYAQEVYAMQPPKNSPGVWNRVEWRPLEGFVVAITPFNFTCIAANLPASPALMGNTVVWKPASTSVYSNYLWYKIFEEAGLPAGVINFLPGSGRTVGPLLFDNRDFAGLHFTGSTGVFQAIWKQTAQNLSKYRTYPRIVGETGGKNFHFVHESAEIENAVNQTVRGSFEYQGQKCSATSRAYIPDSIWPVFKKKLVEKVSSIKMGPVEDFSVFMCAVIDQASFDNIKGYIEHAKAAKDASILVGGECDDSKGWFVRPTVIVTTNPKYKSMEEEIFGPVLTVYVYPANEFEKTLHLCDETSPYALTGSIFALDRNTIEFATRILRNSSGNFYVNDKSTGAIVGQQPFGGARASGTNDKAGSMINLLRWVSARSIKENFVGVEGDFNYPHQK